MEFSGQKLSGTQQLGAMMSGFGVAVSVEVGEAAIGGAVGMAHHKNALGLVQADGHADLLEDEILLEIVARGGESLGAAGNDDHVGSLNGLVLEEFSNGLADAVVETAEHRGIGDVGLGRGVEVEDFAHGVSIVAGDRGGKHCAETGGTLVKLSVPSVMKAR
ncbi:MAG: hypothetical protein WAL71_14590 [Terriglobales bacterium]